MSLSLHERMCASGFQSYSLTLRMIFASFDVCCVVLPLLGWPRFRCYRWIVDTWLVEARHSEGVFPQLRSQALHFRLVAAELRNGSKSATSHCSIVAIDS